MAAAMLKGIEQYLTIDEPPTRRFEFMNGAPAMFYNANAMGLLFEWMMEASDHDLNLLNGKDVNQVIDLIVFNDGISTQ